MPPTSAPVLVVDDDVDVRDALRDTLEQEGYSVAEATNGMQALEYLHDNPPPSLVLLDWNMVPMNAPAFMEALAKTDLVGRFPIVLITADVRVVEKAAAANFSGYLKKPVSIESLFEVVERYCTQASS